MIWLTAAAPTVAQQIPVSRETTYLTAPLAEDGYPDYKRFVLGEMDRSVDPEENGAVPFLLAVWPGGMKEPEQRAVAAELRFDPPQRATGFDFFDPKSAHWRAYRERNLETLRRQARQRIQGLQSDIGENLFEEDASGAAVGEGDIDMQLYRHMDRFIDRPWTGSDDPELARWFDEHAAEFDLIYEAVTRGRFYLPQPDLLSDDRPLYSLRPAAFSSARAVARNLAVRAMLRLGEGDPTAAWKDLRVGLLLCKQIRSAGQIVSMIRVASVGSILHRIHSLCEHSIPAVLASEVKTFLADPDLSAPPVFSEDGRDRLGRLDLALFIAGLREYEEDLSPYFPKGYEDLSRSASDWAEVMRRLNDCWDRIAHAELSRSYAQRLDVMPSVDAARTAFRRSLVTVTRDYGEKGEDREDAVQLLEAILLTPSADQLFEARERVNAQLQLTQVVAAIAEYRAEHAGRLPNSLRDLVPGNLPSLPRDFFHERPLVYRRSPDGFLLYTTGRNGRDDLGSHREYSTLFGYAAFHGGRESERRLRELSRSQPIDGVPQPGPRPFHEQLSPDADDYAVRFPLP